MLSRQNREAPTPRPTPFAARAKDLTALRDAVVDAAGVGTGLWLSYLFVLFYFAIAAGAVTHRDLLLENPVKLPFLNVELPLKAFFILGPLVFLIVHAYVLLHFVLLAGKIGAFQTELEDQIGRDNVKTEVRRQLPSNIFVQSLAGPRDVREGPIGFLLRLVIQISLVAGPIALLVLFQLQFLPYHSEWIANWQRIAVLIELVLLWILWPRVARGKAPWLQRSDFQRVTVQIWLLVSLLPVLLVFTIATFPGEWLEENLLSMPLVPTTWAAVLSGDERALQGWATLHELLVAGNVNYVTDSPKSLWSNVLVLPDFKAGDRVKFDAEGKIAIASDALSLRGRDLQGAVFFGAHLDKADFTGAQLQRANFVAAELRGAKFECGPVTEEERKCAQLRGTSFVFAELQGASLEDAILLGTRLDSADLQGASFGFAVLAGASLGQIPHSTQPTQLQGAWLYSAHLEGASLEGAQLQGAVLDNAGLQGASLKNAQVKYASFRNISVWRATPPGGDGATAALYQGFDYVRAFSWSATWSANAYDTLKSLIEDSIAKGRMRDEALKRIAMLAEPPSTGDSASAKAWADLAKASSPSAASYPDAMAEALIGIGCAAAGAPYVISGLIRHLDDRFEGHRSQEAAVARAFLDAAKCPGARGLSAEDRASLVERS